eukprot:1622564-Pyramimonas_sp.AAC.1
MVSVRGELEWATQNEAQVRPPRYPIRHAKRRCNIASFARASNVRITEAPGPLRTPSRRGSRAV